MPNSPYPEAYTGTGPQGQALGGGNAANGGAVTRTLPNGEQTPVPNQPSACHPAAGTNATYTGTGPQGQTLGGSRPLNGETPTRVINGESTPVPPARPNPSGTGGNTRIPSTGERPTEIHGLSEENGGGASQTTAGGQLANRNGATETVVLNPGATGGLQALRIGGRELPIT